MNWCKVDVVILCDLSLVAAAVDFFWSWNIIVLPRRSTSPASRSKITRDLQDAKPASSSAELAEEPRLRQAAHIVLLSLLRRFHMIR